MITRSNEKVRKKKIIQLRRAKFTNITDLYPWKSYNYTKETQTGGEDCYIEENCSKQIWRKSGPQYKKNTNTKNTKEQKKAKVSADISNYLHHLVQLYAEAKY